MQLCQTAHSDLVFAVAIFVLHAVSLSPDQRWLAAADMAGMVQVWRCETK